ncbi:unnamed protein product [Cercopithifilaria johnstoni]|uniref:Uncharacterized protein n=1 Tax=Cercopithifilaria johnstoni TaxID=2874296 RepID=A0A8J2MAG4_9BILA|nr:unnamed protein product [Cercopithifilaria johnstoni]
MFWRQPFTLTNLNVIVDPAIYLSSFASRIPSKQTTGRTRRSVDHPDERKKEENGGRMVWSDRGGGKGVIEEE